MKFVIGTVIYAMIMLFGYYVLDIDPSLSEILLVSVAASIAAAVEAQ